MNHQAAQSLLLTLALCATTTQFAAAVSIAPAADASVNPTNPALNFGALGTINVGPLAPGGAAGNTGLLLFQGTSLPAGLTSANIVKATLTVYVNRVLVAGALDFAELSSAWTENSVTFNTRPSSFPAFALNVPVNGAGYVPVDVTNVVKRLVEEHNPISAFK